MCMFALPSPCKSSYLSHWNRQMKYFLFIVKQICQFWFCKALLEYHVPCIKYVHYIEYILANYKNRSQREMLCSNSQKE